MDWRRKEAVRRDMLAAAREARAVRTYDLDRDYSAWGGMTPQEEAESWDGVAARALYRLGGLLGRW